VTTEFSASALAEWSVAILAGGLATRMRPLTEHLPKSLVRVAGEPFLAHQLRLLRSRGLRKIVLCVGYLGELIRSEFRDGSSYGLRIDYSFDGPELLGTGGALRKAAGALSDPFFVLYGDSYLPINYRAVAAAFLRSRKQGLMTILRNDNRWQPSNITFDGKEILRYDKQQLTAEMRYIDYGLGVLRADALSECRERAFDLSEIYNRLLQVRQLAAFVVNKRFYEIGSSSGLAQLEALLSNHGGL
jgi:NDP-sugar pyrophosphorylase family protein